MRFLVALSAVALALASVGQAAPARETRQLSRRDNNDANSGPLIGGAGTIVDPPKSLQGDDPARGPQNGGRLVRRVLESRQVGGGPDRGPRPQDGGTSRDPGRGPGGVPQPPSGDRGPQDGGRPLKRGLESRQIRGGPGGGPPPPGGSPGGVPPPPVVGPIRVPQPPVVGPGRVPQLLGGPQGRLGKRVLEGRQVGGRIGNNGPFVGQLTRGLLGGGPVAPPAGPVAGPPPIAAVPVPPPVPAAADTSPSVPAVPVPPPVPAVPVPPPVPAVSVPPPVPAVPVPPPVPGPANNIGPRGLSDFLNINDLPLDAQELLMAQALQIATAATQAILNTSGDNEDLNAAGQDAQAALQTASASIASLQSDVAAGNEPNSADRAAVEQGIREAAAAIDQLGAAAGPNPDPGVTQAINAAQGAIEDVVAGSQQALGLGGDAGVA